MIGSRMVDLGVVCSRGRHMRSTRVTSGRPLPCPILRLGSEFVGFYRAATRRCGEQTGINIIPSVALLSPS